MGLCSRLFPTPIAVTLNRRCWCPRTQLPDTVLGTPSGRGDALFTRVRGIGILRTSPFGHSPKFDARACYELGQKSHRNADFTVSLVPSRSLFPAFLSRF
jgi:hypothetical protein